jgi:hypothetical protein
LALFSRSMIGVFAAAPAGPLWLSGFGLSFGAASFGAVTFSDGDLLRAVGVTFERDDVIDFGRLGTRFTVADRRLEVFGPDDVDLDFSDFDERGAICTDGAFPGPLRTWACADTVLAPATIKPSAKHNPQRASPSQACMPHLLACSRTASSVRTPIARSMTAYHHPRNPRTPRAANDHIRAADR